MRLEETYRVVKEKMYLIPRSRGNEGEEIAPGEAVILNAQIASVQEFYPAASAAAPLPIVRRC